MSHASSKPQPNSSIAVFLFILLLVDSLHFVWAKLIHPLVPPSVSPFYVLAIATVEVGIYGMITKKLNWKILKDYFWFFATIGFLIGISTNINYEAIALVDPGTASLLAQTGTVWGLILGIFWLKDKLAPLQIGGALAAIIGLIVINYQMGEYLQIGALLILISTFSYALHTAITKRYGSNIEFFNFFFYRVLFTTLALFLFSSVRGGLVLPQNGKAWLFLFLAGTTDVVISRTLYYLALRRLKLSIHTIILTLSPVVAISWAYILFGTLPNTQQLIGGGIILLGVALVNLGYRKTIERIVL